jgi:hypothetical protein
LTPLSFQSDQAPKEQCESNLPQKAQPAHHRLP